MSDLSQNQGPAERGPQRTCVGCRAVRSQDSLLRLHLDGSDRVIVGRNGPGRGAWLCADDVAVCFSLAVERKALIRAFRRKPDHDSVTALAGRWHV